MTRKPPDPTPTRLSKVLLALWLFANVTAPATAQQQRLSRSVQVPDVASHGKSTWVENINPDLPPLADADADGDDSQPPDTIQQTPHTSDATHHLRSSDAASAQSPEHPRALIPYAPVVRPFRDAVRAPAKPTPPKSGGLSSRLPARSLQDWKVEDIVLLATVDGKIHARNRNTGAQLWALEADRPMVETFYHPKNASADDSSDPDSVASDFLWIVEPSEDGALYGYKPGSGLGLQNLQLTVKELVENTPYLSDDPPVLYAAEKKNTLYSVDIATGQLLKVYTATNSIVNDPGVCRQVGELDALDDDKCGAIGTLTLTRTEYTLGIFNHGPGGSQICTIKYAEWGPNNRDKDLHQQYLNSKDGRYIHSRHNGEIYAIDHKTRRESTSTIEQKPIFWKKLSSPVARVFDVARPLHSTNLDTPLVLLPQPFDPILALRDNGHVFVNCTETGSWYALSEMIYPLVTGGAFMAPVADKGWFRDREASARLAEGLVGVHSLSFNQPIPEDFPSIGPPAEPPTIQPPTNRNVDEDPAANDHSKPSNRPTVGYNYTQILLAIFIICLSGYGFNRLSLSALLTKKSELSTQAQIVPAITTDSNADTKDDTLERDTSHATDDMVDVQPPAKQAEKSVKFEDPAEDAEALDEVDDTLVTVETNDENDKKGKQKARRGKRGGKRVAEKRAIKASMIPEGVDGVLENTKNMSLQPDIVYQKDSEPQDAPAGLLNLEIQTDRILGHGSGGTLVFEGKFEGREVAVKRMLGQYSELASQEVSLLEQSEDHPNVIRYFCRRQDEHFLYIALELCQASLWELYRDGRRDDVQEKFRPLADEINNQPHRVLRQLAEGLKHLHSFRIVHRDLKPQNMLIAYPKKHTVSVFPRLVISDFGLCKTLPEGASTLIGATVNAGTIGWKAPELISQPKDAFGGSASNHSTGRDSANGDPSSTQGIKRSTDIFALGCVFYYVLTGGLHPFDDEEGWMGIRERNIKANRYNLDGVSIHGPDTVDLIRWMLEPNPEDRPTAAEVLAHPFFWNAEDRLEFLSLASDRFDMEARDGTSVALAKLESHAEEIIGIGPTSLSLSSPSANSRYNTTTANSHHRSASSHSDTFSSMNIPIPGEPNFLAALDKKFIDTLGKQRKYQGHKLVDLLRALRNKHHHWDDMPDDVKLKVGAVPEGYLRYWEIRFPKLTVALWRVVKSLHMDTERRFWRWYGGRVEQ